MPKRPKQHQLEDESITAFRAWVQPWVWRDQGKDYGIDGEVEIFQSVSTTGLLFKVQLKATSGSALVVRLRSEVLSYYKSLAVPVMIVRYHAPTRKLFGRWAHGIQESEGRFVSVRFGSQHELDASAKATASLDVRDFSNVRNGMAEFPVGVSIEAPGVASAWLQLSMSELCSRSPQVLKTASNARPLVRVHWSTGVLTVSLAGFAPFIARDIAAPSGHSFGAFASSVAAALACHLATLKIYPAAVRLFSAAAGSPLLEREELFGTIAAPFVRGDFVAEGFHLAAALVRSGRDTILSGILVGFLRGGMARGESAQARAELDAFREYVDALRPIDQRAAGAAVYSLANILRSGGQYRASIRSYLEAARLDPSYRQRSYFVRELASVLFLSERFRWSSLAYAWARSIGEHDVDELCADALFRAGDFGVALAVLNGIETLGHEAYLQWRFLVATSPWHRGKRPTRHAAEAEKLVCLVDSAAPDSREALLSRIIDADFSNSFAWYNLGSVWMSSRGPWVARFAYLGAALFSPFPDFDAWFNVAGLAHQTHDELLGLAALSEAVRKFGIDFIKHVDEKLSHLLPEDEFRSGMVAALASVHVEAESRRQDRSVQLRIVGAPPGQYRELEILRGVGDDDM